ncbi:MAG: prepilin-type N-terminal cleavage/methylation domain-containing protein [Deltaproteobacteria bacterium]|nr:prepilin-type N-terminal cleavage/methylation domain-containing protein [Deltaproteobacteria bacterium]
MYPKKILDQRAFTLIEVLVAMAIFVMSFLVLIDSQNMNVRASARAKRVSMATLLAQEKLNEMVLKYDGDKISEISEKEEGHFEAPHERYRWEKTSQEFNYDLSFLADMAQTEDTAENAPQSPLFAYLPKISQFIRSSTKEITVTIFWKEGSAEQQVSLTTHVFNFKAPVKL